MASPAAPTAAGDRGTIVNSTANASCVIPVPSNVVLDDLMVAIVERADVTASITIPTGWTEEADSLFFHDAGTT